MSKLNFEFGDRVSYTYNGKTDTGDVVGVSEVTLDGTQWYRIRLDRFKHEGHVSVLPESGMTLLERKKTDWERIIDSGIDYDRERENLIEGDPIDLVDELLALREENRVLKAKVKSGVEVAHDAQKKYHEYSRPSYLSWYDGDPECDRLSGLDDLAEDILIAMEEPTYYETLQEENVDN